MTSIQLFHKINNAVLYIEIVNQKIRFLEKKGYQSRNQSVIDMLIEVLKIHRLPDISFTIFTNDFIENPNFYKNPHLFTFCKNNSYATHLFPNFNFNHWLEAKIGHYHHDIYPFFIQKNQSWNDKKDIIFWSGADTNIIRKKLFQSHIHHKNFLINITDYTKKYYTLEEQSEYKYLLNMNGNSYGGRLNYLFLTQSCVIILKNKNPLKTWDEFFYHHFIPNHDYIEILYDDSENGNDILKRIEVSIEKYDCEMMAKRCFEKAQKVFQKENIYQYLYETLINYGNKNFQPILNHSFMITPSLDYYWKDRVHIDDADDFSFLFKGNDFSIFLQDKDENKIEICYQNDFIDIYENDEKRIEQKYLPKFTQNTKFLKYTLSTKNGIFHILLSDKYRAIHFPLQSFQKINHVHFKTIHSLGNWQFFN